MNKDISSRNYGIKTDDDDIYKFFSYLLIAAALEM